MTYEITADLSDIKILPENELQEILQNVQCILATTKGTVPLDRAFGISTDFLDVPVSAAQARISAELATAIQQFEPRARLKKLLFSGTVDGQIQVVATVEVS